MAPKLLNLIALSSLAILACSFGATPATALSIETSPNHARHLGHHALIAKKKRTTSGRCKPRPSTSSVAVVVPTTTPHAVSTAVSTTHKASSTAKASSSPKPSPSPPPVSTGSAGGGKAGLGWPNDASVPLKNFVTKKVSTVYSWSPWKPAGADALGLEFAPMFWGPKQASDFQRLVVPGYARWALGMNEPDQSGQANIDPTTGAQLWKQYLEPLKSKGYSLVSPAVTSGPSGKPWLQNFFKACGGCTVDSVGLHYYGTDPQDFIDYVNDMHTTFGKPIWVTEYACQNFGGGAQCSEAQVQDFLAKTTSFMDNADFVQQYFYFGFMHDMGNVNPLNQLMASNNEPTALGWQYLG